MTTLYDDPAAFAEDMLDGFVLANRGFVRAVPGGVVRSSRPVRGKVAVVVGGGSGHYPAFCGVVGPGFADGAVVGNIFTSPSTEQAYSVARAADAGGGVLFSYGNYAGDVLNFGLAEQRLNADGVPTATVVVTEDIASAGVDNIGDRRGIAGDFVVFKVAGAAAEEGLDLEGVRAAAERANAATRTLGVAFDGCTMPGADEPLFTVPAGKMGLGLGIHGEPGVSDHDIASAGELAQLLVERLLVERPEGAGDRVGVILNGLGRTKYEELFVVYRTVDRLLREAGLSIVEPEVGEPVTSLDMAGCSLTLTFLDQDLERWWSAAANSPAYRKGVVAVADVAAAEQAPDVAESVLQRDVEITAVGEAGRAAARPVLAALQAIRQLLGEHEDELGRIDSVAGDGDHGRGMVRGARAAAEAADSAQRRHAGPATMLQVAGDALAAAAGGTSGVLWGAALSAAGSALPDDEPVSDGRAVEAVEAALSAICELGQATVGDKTMVDALSPFAEGLRTAVDGGRPLSEAWVEAARTARAAAEQTADLRPRKGRAKPLAERRGQPAHPVGRPHQVRAAGAARARAAC